MIRFSFGLFCLIATTASGAGLSEPLVFTGTCDASAAIALDTNLFVVASDEDNILRFYRPSQPGKPVQKFDLRSVLTGRHKSSEADLEGAARLGQRVFFISSHGRNSQGKFEPKRNSFFALELTEGAGKVSVQPVRGLYTNLVVDLARDSKYVRFDLASAATRPPKSPGGLNIEALAATPEGALLIGFRNPIPDRHALLVPLLNPNEILTNQPPRFGDPILLDLGGLGLRDISAAAQGYYLLAGPDAGHAQTHLDSRLFFWEGGPSVPRAVAGVPFHKINPEGICFLDVNSRSDFLIISDDGTRKIKGQECKTLPESERQFRAYRFTP